MRLDADPCLTLCVGRQGSGKTTFALRYLLNVPAAARFIFDESGQVGKRLNLSPAGTANECELALASQWVCFNPHRMFEGKKQEAFQWFCHWVFKASDRGPGKKVLLVDEIWKYCTPSAIPDELAAVVQTGRVYELELLCCTQRPNRLNGSILNEITELVCFALQDSNGLDTVADRGADRERIARLPRGQFVSYDLDRGGELEGRLW